MKKITASELFENTETIQERAVVLKKLDVFNVIPHYETISIKTTKFLSKANYKRVLQLNPNHNDYKLEFDIPATLENFIILADISMKTNKYSQETLINMKNERLARQRAQRQTMSADDQEAFEIDVYGYPQK